MTNVYWVRIGHNLAGRSLRTCCGTLSHHLVIGWMLVGSSMNLEQKARGLEKEQCSYAGKLDSMSA